MPLYPFLYSVWTCDVTSTSCRLSAQLWPGLVMSVRFKFVVLYLGCLTFKQQDLHSTVKGASSSAWSLKSAVCFGCERQCGQEHCVEDRTHSTSSSIQHLKRLNSTSQYNMQRCCTTSQWSANFLQLQSNCNNVVHCLVHDWSNSINRFSPLTDGITFRDCKSLWIHEHSINTINIQSQINQHNLNK